MINKSSTWKEANNYFDKEIEAFFKKEHNISDILDFLKELSIKFINAEQYYLAIACLSAKNIYKNAENVSKLKTLNTNKNKRKPPKTLSNIIFKEKLIKKGDDAKINKNLKAAFEIYNIVAEIDPSDTKIWKKRLNTLLELLD